MASYTIIKNILQKNLEYIMINRPGVVGVNFVKLINDAGQPKKMVDKVYKLYYNKDTGTPIEYTTEALEGSYVVVTKQQYTEGRHDVVIKDNNIFKLDSIQYIRKLIPDQKGIACDSTNVLILDPTSNKKWNVKTHIAE